MHGGRFADIFLAQKHAVPQEPVTQRGQLLQYARCEPIGDDALGKVLFGGRSGVG